MLYQKASFHHFRNLVQADHDSVEFAPGLNIFIGQNGQGKTNVLEGLYLLTQGQSFRYGDNETLIMSGTDGAALRASVINKDLLWEIQLQLLPSKKNHFLNGKKTSSATFIENFPVIIFSPESLSAIKEGGDERRRLVDSLLVSTHPKLAPVLSEYRKALRTRNRVLRNHLEGLETENETRAILESLQPTFLLLATSVTFARIEALKLITPELHHSMKAISKTSGQPENVDISVDYVISGVSASDFDEQKVFDALNKRLQELRTAELASGLTLVGPHKHDITFLYNQNDSRFFCSQGQQRALILSFKMAQIMYHRKVHKNEPVLMLDDVLSELDSEKRTALISFLKELKTQIFISTTDWSLPVEIGKNSLGEMAVFKIAEGRILERSVI